jgi:hypothetical protein
MSTKHYTFLNKQLHLNNAVKNLYMEMMAVIKWPFKNEEKFVGSIVDVANAAKEEEERKSFVTKILVNI